jgi:hypothetical protein
MRIDSIGNVGIGTSSPTSFGSTSRVLQVQSSDATGYGSVLVGSGTYTMEMLVNQNSGVMSIGSRSNHNLGFATNDTVRATIDSSGNVGIGTTSPSFRVTANYTAPSTFTNATGDFLEMWQNGGTNVLGVAIETTAKVARFVNNNGYITAFNYAGTAETMRIDTSGNLLVGTTSYNSGKVTVVTTGNASMSCAQTGTTGDMIYFRTSTNTLAGYITCPTSTTASFVSISDHRLKEEVAPMTDALATVKALKPVTYKWKTDGLYGEGFIAHELQTVIPHAVAGEKDAVNEDGSIKPQGIDPAKIVVHLVAAIQELSAKNDALEARLTTLESK